MTYKQFKNLKEFGDEVVKQRFKLQEEISYYSEVLVLATCKNGKMGISVPMNYGNPMDSVQKVIDKIQPEMYVIIHEGWMKHMSEIDKKNYKYGEIKKSKDRIEAITFLGKTLDGKEIYSRAFKIIRDGSRIDFDEIINKDGSNINLKSDKLT